MAKLPRLPSESHRQWGPELRGPRGTSAAASGNAFVSIAELGLLSPSVRGQIEGA